MRFCWELSQLLCRLLVSFQKDVGQLKFKKSGPSICEATPTTRETNRHNCWIRESATNLNVAIISKAPFTAYVHVSGHGCGSETETYIEASILRTTMTISELPSR